MATRQQVRKRTTQAVKWKRYTRDRKETTSELCSLFFVVASIQFWITSYLVDEIHVSKELVLPSFSVVSATGPILGVLFGGWIIDWMGGYKGSRGLNMAARSASLLGLAAVVCALPVIWARDFWAIIGLIWFLLFFGGGVLPACTGILIAAVPTQQRPFAASLSTFFYNLLGYFAGMCSCAFVCV